MSDADSHGYEAPQINEHGSVEEITETGSGNNKQGDSTDEYSNTTPLTGSIF
ncbi:lasso RiPP family leader peptide-containing protein [Halosimplex salinum]|uniref:lasso RiPP family leader peptide-containing protein n=1 Tax=Halosimplex salinum TaxID=1710538 RepID=UPI000F46907C|nr:lasso RiPP family leader peptide-containing protein [Halosimplex salinum]